MNPSQFAATNIMPLLARLVLCLAFLPVGWSNLMVVEEFTGVQAQRLRELGIGGLTDPDPSKPDVALGAIRGEAYWRLALAQVSSAEGSQGTAGVSNTATIPPPPADPRTAAGADLAEARAKAAAAAAAANAVDRAPAAAAAKSSPLAPLKQRGLYSLALLADAARIPLPVELAWTVASVQLIGGACVLLGLFTRVWGGLLATIIAALFVTTSLPVLKAGGVFGLKPDQSNLVFAQLGLFVLALGTFMVGPGALSIDRAIFRKRRAGAQTSKSG